MQVPNADALLGFYDPIAGCRVLGAFRAFHGIKRCFTIIHAMTGCHSGFMLLRLLQDNSDVKVLYCGMHQDDLIYGAEHRLLKAIVEAHRMFHPDILAVIEGNASSLIGDDLEGVVQKCQERYHVKTPIVILKGGGHLHDHKAGFEEALLALSQLVRRPKSQSPRSVNIVGVKPDDFRANQDLREIRRLLRSLGIRVNAVIPGGGLNDIKRLSSAVLTVVVGGDGVELAKHLEREYGIPWIITPYPYGVGETQRFLNAIAGELGIPREKADQLIEEDMPMLREEVKRVQFYLKALMHAPAFILGDPGRSFALANMLHHEFMMEIPTLALQYAPAKEMPQELSYSSTIKIKPSREEIYGDIAKTSVAFASSFEREYCRGMNIPLVRFAYPVVDFISLTTAPLVGVRGVVTWIEHIVNTILLEGVKP